MGFVTVGEVTTNLYLTFFIKNVFHFIGNPLLIHSRVVQTKIKSVQVLVSFTFCYFLHPDFKNGIVLVDLKKIVKLQLQSVLVIDLIVAL